MSAFTSWAFAPILCSQERQSLLFAWANSSENCPSGLIDVYPALVDQKAWKRPLAHGNVPTTMMHLKEISGKLSISPVLWSLWNWVYLYSLGGLSMVWKSEPLNCFHLRFCFFMYIQRALAGHQIAVRWCWEDGWGTVIWYIWEWYDMRTRRDPVKFPDRRFSGNCKRQHLSVQHGVALWDSLLQDAIGCTSTCRLRGIRQNVRSTGTYYLKPVIQLQTWVCSSGSCASFF